MVKNSLTSLAGVSAFAGFAGVPSAFAGFAGVPSAFAALVGESLAGVFFSPLMGLAGVSAALVSIALVSNALVSI